MEVGHNIKDENRDKRLRDGDPFWGGVMKEEKFPHSRKLSHRHACREFWDLRGQHNQEEEKKKKKTHRIHI